MGEAVTEKNTTQTEENQLKVWLKKLTTDLFSIFHRYLKMKIFAKFRFKHFLNFIWYIFIMLFVGQLGVVLLIGVAFWQNTNILDTIIQQANSGNFLTFAVALLAGSCYFMIREFHDKEGIKRPYFKSPLLLLSIAAGFTGALLSASLTKSPAISMTESQNFLHWLLYGICILLSLIWWMIEEFQGSVKDLADEMNNNSKAITEKSKLRSNQTRANLRV